MKRMIILVITCLVGNLLQAQINDAQVLGVVNIGNGEVATLRENGSDCIYKSEMLPVATLTQGEVVQVEHSEHGERVEILKDGMPKRIYAFLTCIKDHQHNQSVRVMLSGSYEYSDGKDCYFYIHESGETVPINNKGVVRKALDDDGGVLEDKLISCTRTNHDDGTWTSVYIWLVE